MPSKRAAIQEELVEFLDGLGLNTPYGLITGQHGRGRGSYRSVTFCRARTLDGEVRVYAPSWFLIRSNLNPGGVRVGSLAEAKAVLVELAGVPGPLIAGEAIQVAQ